MLEQIIEQDHNWFLYLNNLGNNFWDPFWLTITNKKTWIPLYVVIAFFLYQKLGWKRTLLIIALLGLGVGLADQITNLLKNHWVRRFRPCHTESLDGMFRLVKSSCGGPYGFTSAHSSNHFVIAVFLGFLFFRKYSWVLYCGLIWAALIAYSRVYIGVHFPLDIFFGSILGICIAIILNKLYFYLIKRFSKQLS